MTAHPDNPTANANTISAIAALMGDPARTNMLFALMGGRALTAGELAFCAGISAQTASGHLARLVDGCLIAMEKQGRHRYFRLASPEVAEAFEGLSALASAGPGRRVSTGPRDIAMRRARTCYNHMAGSLAVGLTDFMVEAGHLLLEDRSGLITKTGIRFLATIGIDLEAGARSKRPMCRTCLDWSERRMHLGGQLGTEILKTAIERNWIRPVPGTRALTITRDGEQAFRTHFGVSVDRL